MKKLLLVLALIGGIAPYTQFLPWLMDNGINLPLLIEQAFEHRISAGAWLDIIASAVTLFVMLFYFRRVFKPIDLVIVVLGTLIAGISLSLPLFFYFLIQRGVVKLSQ